MSLKRTALKALSDSEPAKIKRRIQALLRRGVIARDGGCVLAGKAGACSGPLQAEHLVTRGNSASYGDMRNAVCLCSHHHIHWKPQHSQLYWSFIRQIIGEKRWAYIEAVQNDRTPHKQDWKLVEIVLTREVEDLERHATIRY